MATPTPKHETHDLKRKSSTISVEKDTCVVVVLVVSKSGPDQHSSPSDFKFQLPSHEFNHHATR